MSISKPSVKKQLAFRASYETYNKIMSLCSGENPAFESVSEYLLTVVNRDLALREYSSNNSSFIISDETENYSSNFISKLISSLDDSNVRYKISLIISDYLHKK